MEDLTITAVARQAGIRTSTIRYYESIQLLPEPHRKAGRRRYDPSILDRLAFIRVTQQLGFTLSEIQRLFGDPAVSLPELWQTLAQQKLADVEQLIQHAQQVRHLLTQGLGCSCANVQDCIDCVCSQCQ